NSTNCYFSIYLFGWETLVIIKTEWIDMGTGQLIKLIVETFVLIFALPCVYKDFMNLWKEK
ncbi:hypothetical protein L0N31_23335, partial [Bacteroides thetaiotaomicron]